MKRMSRGSIGGPPRGIGGGSPGAVWRRDSRVRRSLVHDGRAAEPLSTPRLYEYDVRVASGLRRGPFRRPQGE